MQGTKRSVWGNGWKQYKQGISNKDWLLMGIREVQRFPGSWDIITAKFCWFNLLFMKSLCWSLAIEKMFSRLWKSQGYTVLFGYFVEDSAVISCFLPVWVWRSLSQKLECIAFSSFLSDLGHVHDFLDWLYLKRVVSFYSLGNGIKDCVTSS